MGLYDITNDRVAMGLYDITDDRVAMGLYDITDAWVAMGLNDITDDRVGDIKFRELSFTLVPRVLSSWDNRLYPNFP